MKKILFVCHGNICRSPMAEFVMKDLSRKAGLEEALRIASAATSTEEIGNPVYPPARRKLAEHQISCAGKTARQLRREDYQEYDFLVGMAMPICAICGGCWAGIRRGSCPCCWTTPGVRGRRSPIPGILGTLRRPTGTSWRGVRDCWIGSREHTIYKNDREPGPAARASSVVKQRIKSGELHKIRC